QRPGGRTESRRNPAALQPAEREAREPVKVFIWSTTINTANITMKSLVDTLSNTIAAKSF
ncbi:hypothetical protein, partial [Alistipes senegalensis]|uniref:hypothetical protein n=1 Tax=Alistipes senegalensis TaxID=1288121 RepID=UPI001E5ED0ED